MKIRCKNLNLILYKFGFGVSHQILNKGFEYNLSMPSKEWQWFCHSLNISRKCDHAGLTYIFEVLGLGFEMKLYDTRHWNYKKNRWYYKDEELGEINSKKKN